METEQTPGHLLTHSKTWSALSSQALHEAALPTLKASPQPDPGSPLPPHCRLCQQTRPCL